MPTGQVKWFDVKKGFGFIVGPDQQDVFVHFSSIRSDGFRTLKDGETVKYDLYEGEKGCFASNVERSTDQKPSSPTSDLASTSDTVPASAQAAGLSVGHMAASPTADEAGPEEG